MIITDYRDLPGRLTSEFTNSTNRTSHVLRFDGIEHCLSVGEQDLPRGQRRSSRSNDTHDGGWYGTETWTESVKFARFGWPRGAEQLEKLSLQHTEWMHAHTQRDRWLLDVQGDEIDIQRYLDGDPEHMLVRHLAAGKRKGRKYIHIAVNVAVSCGVDGSEVTKRGAVLGGFVYALEQYGYRIALTIYSSVTSWQSNMVSVIVPVKGYSDRFDIDTLAYALVNPSMFRRTIFAVEEALPPAIVNEFGFGPGSYGVPADDGPNVVPDAHIWLQRGQKITVPGLVEAARAAGFLLGSGMDM